MRARIVWQNKVLQVDLWQREPLTVKIGDGEEERTCVLGNHLEPTQGRITLRDGGLLPYFVSADAKGFWVTLGGETFFFEKAKSSGTQDDAHGGFTAPMPGKIIQVSVEDDQVVNAGDVLVILEAMKMEHRIQAPTAGKIKKIHVHENQLVEQGFTLLDFEPKE